MDKARILVVDDTPANIEILTELLTPVYRVSAATNGFDAIRLASSEMKPNLVLLDIMMPDMNGYQVCEVLKAHEETRNIPVIFVTSLNEIQSEQKGFQLGAADYIAKPYNPAIILARVKTHVELYNRTRQLEGLVQERTAELAKALEETEAASKAKSSFLANISHELRTPLNGIIGMTQLLQETDTSEDQKLFLNDARQSSMRLLDTVNSLLDLSKAEAGEIYLSPTDFDIRESLQSLLRHYEQQAEAKGVEFRASFDKTVPKVMHGDIGHIRQALMNLLNNALRFTDQGAIDFTVKTADGSVQEPLGNTVSLLFTVQDTGVGIPPENREYIFEPFAIGEAFMTKAHSGAGLGLSISRQLVSLLGGHIWLEPNHNGGSTFSFTVPCRLVEEPA